MYTYKYMRDLGIYNTACGFCNALRMAILVSRRDCMSRMSDKTSIQKAGIGWKGLGIVSQVGPKNVTLWFNVAMENFQFIVYRCL